MKTLIASLVLTLLTSVSFSQSEESSTLILTYKGGEFLGYCYEHFETGGGQELNFINPDFGILIDEDGMCGIKEEYLNKKFRVTFSIGIITIYVEDVGDDELETEIITKIEMID